MASTFVLTRRAEGVAATVPSFADAGAPGPWLVVAPHDDDPVIGMGVTLLAARAQGIRIDIAVVSDGRMGYAEESERGRIQATRRAEMEASCAAIGIPKERIHWLGFPDSDLASWGGRRFGADGRPTGIANELTRLIRQLRPATVFGPTRADLHPDHVTVANELAISCFHAGGEIWLELGAPVTVPTRIDYAVYCPFPGEPTLEVRGDDAAMRLKLDGIAAFASQRQIGAVVEAQRAAGPREYLQRADWKPYSPALYGGLFAGAAPDAGRNFASDCARVLPLLTAWPEQPWEPLRAAFAESAKTPLLIVGEGSSRLFPAAIACALARKVGGAMHVEHLGGREARALDLRRWQVLAMSNSGKTREVIEAVEPLAGHPKLLALVGQPGGPLQKLVPISRALLDAPETTVAATVSVFAQALALAQAAASAAGLPVPLAALRDACTRALTAEAPVAPAALTRVRRVWWSGAESGCAGELTLKTMETSGCVGIHLPGSMVLHGIEEVLDGHDLVVAFDPAQEDIDALKTRIGATGAQLLRVGVGGDWELPGASALGPDWSAFPQLCAGWRLLAALARALGRDPDKPRRARKVGNEYQGKAGKAGA